MDCRGLKATGLAPRGTTALLDTVRTQRMMRIRNSVVYRQSRNMRRSDPANLAATSTPASAIDAAVAPGVGEIRDALDRLRPHIVDTPLAWWGGVELPDFVGGETRVAFKLELLQRSGSFKARGAFTWAETWYKPEGELKLDELVSEMMKLVVQQHPGSPPRKPRTAKSRGRPSATVR